jgi:hypothetical protein
MAPSATPVHPIPPIQGCVYNINPAEEEKCSLAYTGIGLGNLLLLPSFTSFVDALKDTKATDILQEAYLGSDDPKCVPNLAKLTRQIQGHWYHHICAKADIRDVREIVKDGDNNKVFCHKIPESNPNEKEITFGFDLYDSKRIKDYVLQKLKESKPELCQ